MQKNIQKKFFIFQKTASKLVALNCLNKADNVFHWLSMCYQAALGFCVWLKETFPNAITFTVINKYCKGVTIQIAAVFWPICLVVCVRVLLNTAF